MASKKSTFPCNLEFVREDDYVEYFIFPKLSETAQNASESNETQWSELKVEMQQALEKCNSFIQDHVNRLEYLWHKDELNLQIRLGSSQERILNEETNNCKDDVVSLPPHFHGVTHYGDNISDEWFVVYVLAELTRELNDYIVRIIDNDGEFLLIEAADVLPKWASPDTCEQRVYISNGELQLVQNSPSNSNNTMPVSMAVAKIRQNPSLYRVSKDIQNCINQRFEDFQNPNKISVLYHHQIVRLPLGVAVLLKHKPSLISSAVRAFCDRDSIDVKACRSMRFFPPEQRVRTNVRFTRCLYAMLMHANYVPDRKIGWNLSSATNTPEYKEDLLGIKIASGFEILASQAKQTGNDENNPVWRAYLRSLRDKGYFNEQLEGSVEYNRLMKNAQEYFKANDERFRTAPLVGREILELLRSVDINAEQLRDEENNLKPSESDDWLNISAEQLDAMLFERYGPQKLYKPNGDINAEEFTKNFTEFLAKESNFEGIGDDDDDDSEENDDDEKAQQKSKNSQSSEFKAKVKKNKSMRRACKENHTMNSRTSTSQQQKSSADVLDEDSMSTHVRNFLDFVIPEDNWDSNSEMSDYEDEDDMERNFENLTTNDQHNIDDDITAYMAQMDKELSKTTMGQSFAKSSIKTKKPTSVSDDEDDFDDIESFKPIDIDVNTLKNMMDSYKSQLGGSGPVSNIFSAMGMGMSAAINQEKDEKKKLSESTV